MTSCKDTGISRGNEIVLKMGTGERKKEREREREREYEQVEDDSDSETHGEENDEQGNFSRRKIVSNWDRYQDTEKEINDESGESQRGTDFSVLLSSAGSLSVCWSSRILCFITISFRLLTLKLLGGLGLGALFQFLFFCVYDLLAPICLGILWMPIRVHNISTTPIYTFRGLVYYHYSGKHGIMQ
ncbi:hypothetical protein STEG23_036612, partial [Scotinomys teguina]